MDEMETKAYLDWLGLTEIAGQMDEMEIPAQLVPLALRDQVVQSALPASVRMPAPPFATTDQP